MHLIDKSILALFHLALSRLHKHPLHWPETKVKHIEQWMSMWDEPYATIKSKLQHPPLSPRANPGHLTTSCAQGMGNLTFTGVGWEKLNQKCQAWSNFLFRAPKSLIAMNMCFHEMEEFKGRDRTFVSDWLTKRGIQKLWGASKACMKSRECLNINDFRL